MTALTSTVTTLVAEFQEFKQGAENPKQGEAEGKPWSNTERVKKLKASLCIKANGTDVNLAKMKEIAVSNSIQVSKTTVKDNGDVYIDLPSEENREKK